MNTKILFVILPFLGLMAAFHSAPSTEVKHIVVFKYKPGVTPAQIEEITNAFKGLKNKIPGIVSFEYGVNNSPEKLSKGFTHIYLVTFKDVSARDQYLPHPEHKKFTDLLGKSGFLEEPFVVDFQIQQ